MAIFYEHIKGLAADANSTTYTWIKWHKDSQPEVFCGGDASTSTSKGILLTSNWGGNNTIDIKDSWKFSKPLTVSELKANNVSWLKYENSSVTIPKAAVVQDDTEIQGTLSAKRLVANAQGASISGGLAVPTGNVIVAGGYCEATYFNAKSDKRLKENIQPISSVLEWLNSINVYTFNFIGQNHKHVGVIAQELDQLAHDGVSFVDKTEQFLAVHESKLVYMALQAIKEQQAIINDLRAEVEVLKHGKIRK